MELWQRRPASSAGPRYTPERPHAQFRVLATGFADENSIDLEKIVEGRGAYFRVINASYPLLTPFANRAQPLFHHFLFRSVEIRARFGPWTGFIFRRRVKLVVANKPIGRHF